LYKNNSRDTSKFKGFSLLQLYYYLTGKCQAIGYYSYTNRCLQARQRETLENMKIREIFILGCQRIGEPLIELGFSPFQKGQLLRKTSEDKEFSFEIYFQSLHTNWRGGVSLIPQIRVTSKSLKKWRQNKYNEGNEVDLIFQTRLENLTPLKDKNYDWNVSLNNQQNVAVKLIDLLMKYAIPFFDIFENKNRAVDFMTNNGIKFNEHFDTKFIELPIDFLCYYADKKTAQIVFDNYIKENKMFGHAKRVYDELQASGQTYLETNRYVTDRMFNLAYLNDLRINQ